MAAAGLVLMIGMALSALNAQVFQRNYTFDARPQQAEREPSFVTDVFDLKGHTSNVELTTRASVDNSWLVVNYALINEDTGQAYDFGREVSWYHGRDEDGDWSEGSSQDVAIVPSVPPGRYYLRVEPERRPIEAPFATTFSSSAMSRGSCSTGWRCGARHPARAGDVAVAQLRACALGGRRRRGARHRECRVMGRLYLAYGCWCSA